MNDNNMVSIPHINLIKKDLASFICKKSKTISTSFEEKTDLKAVLLTGSTGFLGKYLLNDLLTYTNANIYCLIRVNNNEDIQEKFYQKLSDSGLDLKSPRVILIKGNFKENNLGLEEKILKELENSIDAVYHCGAFVHHLHNYEMLRTDVIATKFLIDLCLKGKQKYLHYISTMNISNAIQDAWKPAENLAEITFCDMGYIQVKWTCEKIIYSYIDRGYPFYIYRPGNITGHSKTGYCIPWHNHALLLLKGFLQHGVVPEWNDLVEMVPVDFLSKAIIKLSLNEEKTNKRTYNLHNSATLGWTEYVQKVADFLGCKVKFVDAKHWRTDILPYIERNNPLTIFKDFYSIETNKFNYQPPKDLITEKQLEEIGISFSSISYDHLIKVYTEFLSGVKFLK